jgi:Uma2 family endonuclease
MSVPYHETLSGTPVIRPAPGKRHEKVCAFLHRLIAASVANFSSTRLLPPRTRIRFSDQDFLCPDLALASVEPERVWLAAEIISADDHKTDTVVKKQIYEDLRIPRLWVVDPRYDNVEVYHSGPYGLALKEILAGRDVLSDKLLPEFEVSIQALFAAAPV